MSTENKNGKLVAIIAMMFLFAMISFVTNMAAPFGQIWKIQYEWAGMMGNMMNFAAYLFMGVPAGMMISKMGYKKTALVALALGFVGIAVQFISSKLAGTEISTYVVYLLGAFICGFCVCILNTVVNPMLNLLGGGGNKGNQLIQTGGSLNSLAGTLTPLLVGAMIGQVTDKTSMSDVSPLLMIAMGIFAASFAIIYFTKLQEPEQADGNMMEMIKGALGYRHLVLGIIAIFLYVGVEVGIPGEMIFYLSDTSENAVLGSAAIAGTVAAVYWLLMLVGRLTSSFISGKVSTRAQIVTVCTVALVLLIAAIFVPESNTFTLPGTEENPLDLVLFKFTGGELPIKCIFFVLCGLCTSVMWGGIFNLATEGLGKYTAAASGLFMAMVVGGGVVPLVQDLVAGAVGYIQSYWVIVASVAYMLFYALIGSKPAKK
ncbi:MFS transporter [Sodaliphilus sp.]|uniref:MFS transporter n=1 Tax=Sodaliphilus sp. TaxID=2815818 RepID=UPI0038903797